MPKILEKKLKKEAKKKGLKGKKANAYVYGTMRKTGWKPSRSEMPMMDVSIHRGEKVNKKNAKSKKRSRGRDKGGSFRKWS